MKSIEKYFEDNHNIIPALSGLTSYNEEDTYFEMKICAYSKDVVFLELKPYLYGVKLEDSAATYMAIMNIAKTYGCSVESIHIFSAEDLRYVKMYFQLKFNNSRDFLNEVDLMEVDHERV